MSPAEKHALDRQMIVMGLDPKLGNVTNETQLRPALDLQPGAELPRAVALPAIRSATSGVARCVRGLAAAYDPRCVARGA